MLGYTDRCVIRREAGNEDDFGNVSTVAVYEGFCDFQAGGESYPSMIIHSDMVYIQGAVMAQDNDLISITTALGIKHEGVVRRVKHLGLGLTGKYVTEMEIKQSTER